MIPVRQVVTLTPTQDFTASAAPTGMNTDNGTFDVVGDLLSALKDGAFG